MADPTISAKLIQGAADMRDTLVNLFSGIGGPKDKGTYARYSYVPLQKDQLEAAFRSDWVSRKVVSIPAADATREWRSWQADADQIEALEDTEDQFRIKIKTKQAVTMARLYGGAALIMGVDSGNSWEPLEIGKVPKGALKFVHAVSCHGVSSGPIERDISSPWYLQPQWYSRKADATRDIRIHPSRVIQFIGNTPPDISEPTTTTWGEPILQAVDDAVRASGRVAGGIAALIDELKLDVISIPGLTQIVATQEGRDMVTSRLAYANQAKSIVNALVLDKDETWERIQINLAGMTDLMKEYFVLAAGAADIPATRMLAQSPKGLNSTGDNDTRNYYDMVSSEQDTEYAPRLEPLDNVLIRSTFGSDEPGIFYEWQPLWQMSNAEKATIAKDKAAAFQIDVNAAVFPEMILREMRANQLIEDGTYPGLEGALEEADALGLLSNDPQEQQDPNEMDPNAPPANENDPNAPKPGSKVHVTVKTGDAAGMIRRFRRRVRRNMGTAPVRGSSSTSGGGGSAE